jgi:hypothetical protein
MNFDDNSGDTNRLWSLNMTEPQQLHGVLGVAHADEFASANALRDSLADDLLKWQVMESRLRRASREAPLLSKSVFTRCYDTLTKFSNLSAHELDRTQDLQAFSAKIASLNAAQARYGGGARDYVSGMCRI